MRTRAPGRDRGQITLLVIGLAVVLMLVVSVVVGASQAFLQRRALAGLADGAAIAAAQQIAQQQVYTRGVGERLPVSEPAARAAVQRYLAGQAGGHAADGGLRTVTVDSVQVDPADGSVAVRLTARADLPILSPVTDRWSDGVPIAAAARVTVAVR